MKQIVLASILAIALVPALSFADNKAPRPPMGSGAVQNNHEQDDDMWGVPPMGSGAMMGSGMGMSGAMMHEDDDKNDHPRPSMGSGMGMTGAMMKHEMEGLKDAMEKLTPEQRVELAKMIRTYLESKGIQVPTPEVKKGEGERKGWDGSIKGNKTPDEVKAQREIMKEKIKVQREIMKEKIKVQREIMKEKIKALKEKQKEYTGHVTLMK